jgi:hypothetical protein
LNSVAGFPNAKPPLDVKRGLGGVKITPALGLNIPAQRNPSPPPLNLRGGAERKRMAVRKQVVVAVVKAPS